MLKEEEEEEEEKTPENECEDERKPVILADTHIHREDRSLLHELYKDDPNAPSGSRQLRCNFLKTPCILYLAIISLF